MKKSNNRLSYEIQTI